MFLFEDMIQSMDDFLVSMRLAVDDQLVLFPSHASQMVIMLLSKAIVPT